MGGKQSSFSPPSSGSTMMAHLADMQAFLPKEYQLLNQALAKERFKRTAAGGDVITPKQLVTAIETDNVFLLQQLLIVDADVNFHITTDHQTPLHFAARLGLFNMTALLLDKDADVFAQTTSGCRAIYLAAFERRVQVFRLLLLTELRFPRGGVLSGKTGSAEEACIAMLAYREQARSCYVPLAHLAGDTELTDLWQVHLDDVTSHHDKKIRRVSKPRTETFLHALISSGNVEAVLTLLHLGIDLEGFNKAGLRPIHIAAKRADLDILSALLENGADINAKSSAGDTPILTALDSDPDGSVVQLLLQHGADMNIVDRKGISLLDRASKANYLAIVANILKYGPDVSNCHHRGLIFDAACYGDGKFMKGLLQKWFNPNVVRSGKMPHHLAAEHGRTEVLHELLLHNCRMNEVAFGRKTALELAIRSNLFDTALLLVKHGASIYRGSGSTSNKPLWLSLCCTSAPYDFKLALLKSSNPGIVGVTVKKLTKTADSDVEKNSPLAEWFEKRTSSPLALAESCRGTIRKHLTSVNPTRSIWAPVHSIDIPSVLKNYILLESE